MTRFIELSHPIEDGMITFPGLPGPEIGQHLSRADSRGRYAPDVEFEISRISMVGNTGTYVDSPFHRYADGADLAALPLSSLADLPAVVIACRDHRAIDADVIGGVDVAGAAVLLHTGDDERWRTPHYAEGAAFLTAAGAESLVAGGAALVGIDSVNIDDASDPARPAHSILLAAAIPVVEHLTNLGELPAAGARFTAVPPLVRGGASFPVRAYATLP